MTIVDTNILLRASLNDDPEQSRIAQSIFADADKLVVPTYAICEFVWVMLRSYKLSRENVASAVLRLINIEKVVCDDESVAAGLGFLSAGGDFADGVIEFEGRRLGGQTFVTFDRQAAAVIMSQGRRSLVLDAG
jgi:predicted nucleic-acid-binding protein